MATREALLRARAKWNAKNKVYRRQWFIKRHYDLTPDAYEKLMAAANHRCQICTNDTQLCIDHDHLTGKVRGVLCRSCNLAIANARDSQTILRNAISYLARIF